MGYLKWFIAVDIGEIIRMGFAWQGSDHIQEIWISSVVIYDTKFIWLNFNREKMFKPNLTRTHLNYRLKDYLR